MSQRALTDADYHRLLAFRVELRHFIRYSETVAAETGLTPALHQLLLAIRGSTQPGGSNIAAIAETLSVRHHTAVELAQRAEQLGLISRTRDTDDHRQIHLQLTTTGATSLETLSRRHLPAIAQLAKRLTDVIAAEGTPTQPDDAPPRNPPRADDHTEPAGPVDLDAPHGEGPLWGLASKDLNATLLCWPPGDGVPEHVNGELDILLIVTAGTGTATIDSQPHTLELHHALLIAKETRRQIRAGGDGLRYVSIHRRREGLQIEPHQPTPPPPQPQPKPIRARKPH